MVPAYMAIRFKGFGEEPADGWLRTSQTINTPFLPTSADDPLLGPPNTDSYFEVRAYSNKVDREYEGTGTTNGPNTVKRAGHADFSVEKVTDRISPYLLEYCASGKRLSIVHLVNVDAIGKLYHVRLEDVAIATYEFSASRFFGETRSEGSDQNGPFDRWSTYVRGTGRVDKFTLHHRAISVQVRVLLPDGTARNEAERGWDTGSETTWPPPPPPPQPSP